MPRKSSIPPQTVAAWKRRIAAGWTLRAIAAQWGVDMATVRRHAGATGRRTGPRLQPLTVDDAVAAYERCGSSKRAAAELGVTWGVMRDRLWRAGILTDPTGRGRSEPPPEFRGLSRWQ